MDHFNDDYEIENGQGNVGLKLPMKREARTWGSLMLAGIIYRQRWKLTYTQLITSVTFDVRYIHMSILKLIDVHTRSACTIEFSGQSLVRSLSTLYFLCTFHHCSIILMTTPAHKLSTPKHITCESCTLPSTAFGWYDL